MTVDIVDALELPAVNPDGCLPGDALPDVPEPLVLMGTDQCHTGIWEGAGPAQVDQLLGHVLISDAVGHVDKIRDQDTAD